MVPDLTDQEEAVSDILVKILRSPQLQHVDLSDTGLTEGMLMKICRAISHSACLLCVHLSGNPGLKDHIMKRI